MSKSRLCFISPFQGQHDYFLQYLGCFCQETGQSQKSKRQNQNLTKFSKFVKICWFQHFPVLQVCRGHLRKILTAFSSLAADLIKNLMLNRLAPISNPKNEKAKSLYELFLLPFFVLRPTYLNKGSSFFPDSFGQLRNFFQVGLKQKKQLGQTKVFNLLVNLVPKVFLLYTNKTQIKKLRNYSASMTM